MSQPRQLAPLALAQLAAWRAYAAKWNWHIARRDTETGHRLGKGREQYHAICAVCDTSIAVVTSEGIGYLMNTELLLDGVTRHLRNQHRGIESEIYGGKDPSSAVDSRGVGDPYIGSANPS